MDHNETKLIFENWNKFVEGLQQIDEAPNPRRPPFGTLVSKRPTTRTDPRRTTTAQRRAAAGRTRIQQTLPTAQSGPGQAQRPTSGVQSRTPISNARSIENNVQRSESAITIIESDMVQLLAQPANVKAGIDLGRLKRLFSSVKMSGNVAGAIAVGGMSAFMLSLKLAGYFDDEGSSAEEKAQAAGISDQLATVTEQKSKNLEALSQIIKELAELQGKFNDASMSEQMTIRIKTKDLMDQAENIKDNIKLLDKAELKVYLIAEKLLKQSIRKPEKDRSEIRRRPEKDYESPEDRGGKERRKKKRQARRSKFDLDLD